MTKGPEPRDLPSALGILASRGWFAQRSKHVRAQLAAIARLRTFSKNEAVYLAGDAPNGVFGLVSGSLSISFPRGDGEDYTMHRASVGFWVGDLALFSGAARLVSIRAAGQTSMVQLPIGPLSRLVKSDPRLYADFYALTYDNFQTALQIISNLAITSTDKRFADRLLIEEETWGTGDGWIPLSQSELAKLLAVSPPTMQRVIGRFVRAGLITTQYGRVRIKDWDALRQLRKA